MCVDLMKSPVLVFATNEEVFLFFTLVRNVTDTLEAFLFYFYEIRINRVIYCYLNLFLVKIDNSCVLYVHVQQKLSSVSRCYQFDF